MGLLVLLGTLVWATPGAAQVTHYVDNIDACSGQAPCHVLIGDAVAAAVPDDVIAVFPGVYHESVFIGPGKRNVVLKAHVKARPPVITGAPSAFSVTIAGAQNVQLLNLVLEARVLVTGSGTTGVLIEGNLVTSGGIHMSSASGGGTVRDNTVLADGIRLGTNTTRFVVEGNVLTAGSITLCCENLTHNAIRRNVIRDGGLRMAGRDVFANVIDGNFVSGNPSGDGISVEVILCCSGNVIQRNTSIENAGCDLNELQRDLRIVNTWRDNRFATKCGAATD
jgi:hypothetical protein